MKPRIKPFMKFDGDTKRWYLFHQSGNPFLDDGYASAAEAMNRLVSITAKIWLEHGEAYWRGSIPEYASRTGKWLGSDDDAA